MTVVKIYSLMHAYPTLVREIVTPTLPTFATACLQILKPPVSSKAAKAPYNLVETIFEALSTLLPLYPTTLRQFAGKIRAETRLYVTPTISDGVIIPASLQASSRHIALRLHMTAAKGGDSTEWAKHLDGLIKAFHFTAGLVLRGVIENWEPISGHVSDYTPQQMDFNKDPQGDGTGPDQFPSWTGIYAGSQRMIGQLDFIGEYLRCRTKTAVTIPVGAIVDIVTRMSSIFPPTPGREKSGLVQMNPAVGREEKDELWTVFPDIQLATMKLLLVVIQRLGRNFAPVAPESLEQLLRMFESSYRLPEIRMIVFHLTREILEICGPTMPKLTVEGLSLIIKTCCRDLLGSAGHLKRPKLSTSTPQGGAKPKSVTQNVDAFLSNKTENESLVVSLNADHVSAAAKLLTTLFSHVPQQHLPSSLRAQMLRTAILAQIKEAQVASVLHPSRDRSGRTPQVILPYLTQQFPRDECVEILRFNFRPIATGFGNNIMDLDDTLHEDELEEESSANGFTFDKLSEPSFTNPRDILAATTAKSTEVQRASSPVPDTEPVAKAPNPFLPMSSSKATISSEVRTSVVQPSLSTNSLKRKSEEADIAVAKRVEIDTSTIINAPAPTTIAPPIQAPTTLGVGGDQESDGESDNESAHLNMELDTDEEEEDNGDGGEEV